LQKDQNVSEKDFTDSSERLKMKRGDSVFGSARVINHNHLTMAIKFALAYTDRSQYFLTQVQKEYVDQQNLTDEDRQILAMRVKFDSIEQLLDAPFSTTVIPIMEAGLRAACLLNHELAIKKILNFSDTNLTILTINRDSLQGLLINQNYECMALLTNGRIHLRKKFGQLETNVGNMKMADFVAEALDTPELSLYDVKKLIIKMQRTLEFDDLARILVWHHPRRYDPTGGIILSLCTTEGLDLSLKDLYLVEIMKACLSESRFDIGILIWNKFEPVLTFYSAKLVPVVITVFEESSHALEYKIFFLKKVYPYMSNNEQNRVLQAIYKRILDDSKKFEFMRNNLNPLRNSMQLKDMLESISSSNPRASESVTNINNGLTDLMFEYLSNPKLIARIIRFQSVQKDIYQ
jgi:hypothetical protein